MENDSAVADSSFCAEDLVDLLSKPSELLVNEKQIFMRKKSEIKETHPYKALMDLNFSVIEDRSGPSSGKPLRLLRKHSRSRQCTEEAKTALEFSPRDDVSPTENMLKQTNIRNEECFSILSFNSDQHRSVSAPSQILSEASIHESSFSSVTKLPMPYHPFAELPSPWDETK
jgi:hypothetical protein